MILNNELTLGSKVKITLQDRNIMVMKEEQERDTETDKTAGNGTV